MATYVNKLAYLLTHLKIKHSDEINRVQLGMFNVPCNVGRWRQILTRSAS